MIDEEFQKYIVDLRTFRDEIFETYIKEDALLEVNLNARTKKALLAAKTANRVNPELFTRAFDHIRQMLRTGHFKKFLASVKAEFATCIIPGATSSSTVMANDTTKSREDTEKVISPLLLITRRGSAMAQKFSLIFKRA